MAGWRVLQVGCDPKQDSTRLLLGGETITTALDYLRRTPPQARRLEDIVHGGFAGVSCVEAGGPEPGVGCAGRGILSTFELLEQLGIQQLRHDFVLYDVLGDVVCGGFAVPLREEYAELVFIVTSGEFMALYAANNILRGIRNYEGRGPRVGGILINERGLDDEAARVERFAQAVKLPIVARFPRSESFSEAERLGRTMAEVFPDGDLARQFRRLAELLAKGPQRHHACPLAADQLERLMYGDAGRAALPGQASPAVLPEIVEKISGGSGSTQFPNPAVSSLPHPPPKRYCSKGVRTQGVLFGCAFNGAAHTVMQVRDAATVVHGPRSCAFLSSQGVVAAARRVRNPYGTKIEPGATPHLYCSEMNEHTVIFGGNTALEKTLRQVAAGCHAAIFVVTTCASGIIGDDVRLAVEAVRGDYGQIPMVLIPADGDITGDYMQGVLDTMRAIAKAWIDPAMQPEADTVNVVAEKNLAANTEENFETVQGLLTSLGIRVNGRFIRRCTASEITGFCRGALNLLAYDDAFGRTVRDFLTDHCGASFASGPFPVGFQATSDWLRDVAGRFDKTDVAEAIIAVHRETYQVFVSRLRPELEGKRIVIAAQNHCLDWVLDTALDIGMEVLQVGIMESVWDDAFLSRYQGRIPLVFPYPKDRREQDMRELKPDLTLINYPWQKMPDGFRFDHIPICPDVGFFTGITAAARWQRLLRLPAKEGWRRDI
jgi:nitrogenase iron protein